MSKHESVQSSVEDVYTGVERRTLALSYLISNLFEVKSLDECLDVAIKGLSMLDFFQSQISLLEDGCFVVKRNHMDKKYQFLLEQIWGQKFLAHKIKVRTPFALHLLDSKIVTTVDIEDAIKVKLEDFIKEYASIETGARKGLGVVTRVASILPRKMDLMMLPLNYRGKVIGAVGISKASLEREDVFFLRNLCELFAQAFEKVETKVELRESSNKLNLVLSTLEGGVDIVTYDYIVRYQNKFLKDRFGDLAGKKCYVGYMGLDKPCSLCPMRKAIQYKKTFRVELTRKDGRDYELISMPLEYPDGHVDALEMVRDITERKKAEEELRKTKDYLNNLLNYANAPIMVWDNKNRITLFNNAFEVFTGHKKESVLGRNIDILFPPLQKEEILQTIEKATKGEKWKSIEMPILCKDKQTKIALWNSANITDKEGRIVATIAQGQDITERKKMQSELRRYSEHLEQLVEERSEKLKEAQERLVRSERLAAIGEVATMVGHDLRNPLQSIENAIYYLNNELPYLPRALSLDHRKVNEMLRVINDSVSYADRIVRDLQDFSATKKPMLQKTNINIIVRDTLSQVETPENVKLITKLSDFPKIEADKEMIKRVFVNLAINGIQAMEKGGTLKVSTKKTKGFVEVNFEDTGIGIPKENLEKIFVPFFTTKAQGMGMGLPICKKFVEIHGGSIEVESEEGKGSTFTVKLPIQPEK